MIVQQLARIQQQYGWLPESALRELAERSHTPPHRLEEVSSFFPHFRRQPPPRVEVNVCRDMACHLAGAEALVAALRALQVERGYDEATLRVTGVSCLGRCDRAPAVCLVSHERKDGSESGVGERTAYYLRRDAAAVCQAVAAAVASQPPPSDGDRAHPGAEPQAWRIDVYAHDPSWLPYSAVRRFLAAEDREAERERVLAALETAGLLGMGGAGGRTYKKWRDVWHARGVRKYVVCNADESEPGTFKDRELLLHTPHLVLEGVILGGLVTGAERGYVYIRHEYEEQVHAVERAIAEAERLGVCGANLLGTGIDFPVEVFISPGGYICGEQTALIEAMEDKRAEPRNRPPELQTNGLGNMPTLLNNVETLAWVPAIVLREEGSWFAAQGAAARLSREPYRGLRFFSISGDVRRPGVYEVPIGITLRELLDDCAGGVVGGPSFQAIALSGPSGGFLPRHVPVEYLHPKFVRDRLPVGAATFDLLDLELDIALARAMGIMLGAGIVVYGEGRNMLAEALNCSEFFRNESCGKCVPCRLGSQRLVEIAADLYERRKDAGKLKDADALVNALAETMELTAICGLGTVAANPLATWLRYFSRAPGDGAR